MERRRFLVGAANAIAAGGAGCGGRVTVPTAGEDTPASPTPRCPRMRPVGVDQRVVCAETTTEGTRMAVTPETAALPDAEFRFEVTNRDSAGFSANRTTTQLFKWADGRWHQFALFGALLVADTLEPGETWEWTLVADNEKLGADVNERHSPSQTMYLRLGGGIYAFGLHGRFEGDDRSTVFVTQFQVEGDPLPLVPTDDVTAVERSARTVEVAVDVTGDGDQRRTLVVTRAGAATDLDRSEVAFTFAGADGRPVALVTEGLYAGERRWQSRLRDALAVR